MPNRAGLTGLLLVLAAASSRADSSSTAERTVQKLAEGIYFIRHADAADGYPQGNTTVVIGSKAVLVVDSCYLPSDARKDIAQIRQWTKLPVRYLVNSHWHPDHVMGNGIYAEAFPGLSIIAQRETRKQLEGYNPGFFERYPRRTAELKTALATGKEADGSPLSTDRRKELNEALPAREKIGPEFKALVDRLPDVTFDEALSVDLGGREVQIQHPGRGHTAGDTIVYVPSAKLVAVGDMLAHPVPYIGGYPVDLVPTLRKVALLDAKTMVPGHGEVLEADRARAYLAQVIEFVTLDVAAVSQEIYRVGNGPGHIELVRAGVMKAIDVAAWRKAFAGDDKDSIEFFDGFSLPRSIEAIYAQLWAR